MRHFPYPGLALALACGGAPATSVVPGTDDRTTVPASDAVAPVSAETSPDTAEVPAAAAPLRIASWNIMRLGQRSTLEIERVAGVLARFDLVAIQEVMTAGAARALDEALPDHDVLLTDGPFPPSGRYREFYAFAYRRDRMTPLANASVPDPDDHFLRDPFLGCFEVTGGEDLCLLTVHIVFGDRVAERKAEILRLDDALRWAQDIRAGEEHWVVLGDFNRPVDDGDRDTDPEEEWMELLDRRRLRVPVVLVGGDVPTTLGGGGYANAYDHVFVSVPLEGRVRAAGRVDIVASECGGDFEGCKKALSDHAPVFVELAPE